MLLPCPHRAFAADGRALAGSSMIFLPEPKLNNKSTEYIQEFIKKFQTEPYNPISNKS
jgi:hypothetical protein